MIGTGKHILFTAEFDWRDLWVGAYVDEKKLRLHLCPLPTLHLCVQPALHSPLRMVLEGIVNEDGAIQRMRRGAMGYLGFCLKYRRFPNPRFMVIAAVMYERVERGHG